MYSFVSKLALLGVASAALSTAASAADIRTFAFAYQGQFTPDGQVDRQILDGSASNLTSSGVVQSTLDHPYSVSQWQYDGSESLISWHPTSTAIGGSGVLKAGVTSSLDAWLSDVDDGSMPNYFSVQAQTSFSDTFTVGGDAAFVSFAFEIDGDSYLEGDGTTAGLVLFGDLDVPYFAPQGWTDTILSTKLLPVIDGQVDLSLVLDASITHDLRSLTPGNYLGGGGYVDYLNTLKLTKVTGFSDETGSNEVAVNSLTGADGFNYARTLAGVTPLAAAPEPASWAMMVAGFGLLGAAMRRRTTVSFA